MILIDKEACKLLLLQEEPQGVKESRIKHVAYLLLDNIQSELLPGFSFFLFQQPHCCHSSTCSFSDDSLVLYNDYV